MTRQQIADGLMLLVLQLANDKAVPDGWTPHEWAYVKGIACHPILQLRDRLDASALVEGSGSRDPIGVGSSAALPTTTLGRSALDVVATEGGKASTETRRP